MKDYVFKWLKVKVSIRAANVCFAFNKFCAMTKKEPNFTIKFIGENSNEKLWLVPNFGISPDELQNMVTITAAK